MSQQWKPGEESPEDAEYTAYDENGRCGGKCYLTKGERFPATQHSGSYYVKSSENTNSQTSEE